MATIPLDTGFTLDLDVDGGVIYLDLKRTGSIDEHPDYLHPWEARDLAAALIAAAEKAEG